MNITACGTRMYDCVPHLVKGASSLATLHIASYAILEIWMLSTALRT